MTPTFLDTVLRGAEALAARDAVGALPDPDLVRRFAADRDPAAFAVLVRRHGPLVWGVCRNLLPADADAEDAFQATFLALVRSAGSVRQTHTLGPWLHGVAYRVAMKARRAAARRRQREQVVAVPEPDHPVPDAAWDELQAAVHEEVCRLPEKLRLPFVLCGLEGRPQKDAARLLGWKVGTVSGRLTQARQRLLDRLARRGVPVSVAAGATALGLASGGAAVPTALCLKALAAAKDPAAASPMVLTLARGVTSMSPTRTKLLAAAVLVAGALTTGIGSGFLSRADAQPAPPAGKEVTTDQIKKAIDFLRSHQTKGRWEYKFVPIQKPMRLADVQTVLAAAELENWEYCGCQDVATADLKPVPHMVFKRLQAGAAADANTAAGLYALALAQQQAAQDAAAAEARARKQVEAKDKARTTADQKAVQAAMEAELAKSMYAAQLEAAKKALEQERDRALQLERMVRQLRDEQAAVLTKMKELESRTAGRTGSILDPKAVSPHDLILPLRNVAARDAIKAITKLSPDSPVNVSIDERSNTLFVHGPADTLAKIRELITKSVDVPAAGAGDGSANQAVTLRVPLTNVDGKTAAEGLARALPAAKVVAEVHANAIVLKGPSKAVDEAATLVRKAIDVKPADPTAGDGRETTVVKLRHASAADVQAVLEKVFDKKGTFVADPTSNSLIISAPLAIQDEARKLIIALDEKPEGKK